jgi:alkylhydroperoxidase family enzyme
VEADMNTRRGRSAPPPVHPTSRLAPPDPARVSAPARRILDEETRRFGAPLNTTMVWAHHPALLAAYKAWSKAVSAATLIPAPLKYLVYVRVAALNGCPF